MSFLEMNYSIMPADRVKECQRDKYHVCNVCEKYKLYCTNRSKVKQSIKITFLCIRLDKNYIPELCVFNKESLIQSLTCRGGEEGACSAVRASTTSLEGPWPMVLTAATRKS